MSSVTRMVLVAPARADQRVVEDVGERGREDRQRDDRRAIAAAPGIGKRPRPVDDERERQQDQRRRGELAGRRHGRVDAAEAAAEDRRQPVEEAGDEHRGDRAARSPVRPATACGPAIAATPPKPSRMPTIFAGVIFSSAVAKCATSSAKIGAVAFRIEAAPAPSRAVA